MEERNVTEKFRKARQQPRHSRKTTYSITGVPETKDEGNTAIYVELFIEGVDITLGKKTTFDNATPADISNYREYFQTLKKMYGDAARFYEQNYNEMGNSVVSVTIRITDTLEFERRFIFYSKEFSEKYIENF